VPKLLEFYCSEHGDVVCRTCKENAPDFGGSVGFGYGAGGTVMVGGDPEEPPSQADIEAMIKEAGIPIKRALLRVIPAVQSQTIGDVQITIASLEIMTVHSSRMFA
jgi:hypothetical protein